MRKYILVAVISLIIPILCSSCGSPSGLAGTSALSTLSPVATPLSPVTDTNSGAIFGRLNLENLPWGERELFIYAAPFYPTDGDGGFFILDPSMHPSGPVYYDGSFVINNVPPGKYVLVVGPTPEDAVAIRDPKGTVRIFAVEAGQVLYVESLTP
jgi:hypothetical protein